MRVRTRRRRARAKQSTRDALSFDFLDTKRPAMTIPLSLGSGEQRTLAAWLANLADASAFAQSFCDDHGIDRRTASRLTLVIEELFTNTVRHGYRGDSDREISVALRLDDGAV